MPSIPLKFYYEKKSRREVEVTFYYERQKMTKSATLADNSATKNHIEIKESFFSYWNETFFIGYTKRWGINLQLKPNSYGMVNVLKKSKTIAVVGLSDLKPERTSYMVQKQCRCWIRIIPVNYNVDECLEKRSFFTKGILGTRWHSKCFRRQSF